MNYYTGIDGSLEESCVCAIDGSGKIVRLGEKPTHLCVELATNQTARITLRFGRPFPPFVLDGGKC
jgi:hypothetical protein